MTLNPPVFLRPSGRTGGTLFVTMLDTHPQLAMSYEIYEDRLLSDTGTPLDTQCAVTILEVARRSDPLAWVRAIPDRNFRTFVVRARRADVEIDEVLAELAQFAAAGNRLDTIEGRLDFIDRLMILRMRKIEKSYWGGKVLPTLMCFTGATLKLFSMIRDGRDVLASRLKTGNFRTNALACALDWREKILELRHFACEPEPKR